MESLPEPVEQDIGCLRYHIGGGCLHHIRVVEIVPLVVQTVFGVRGVVTAAEGAKVVGYSVQVVLDLPVPVPAPVLDDIVGHIQALDWEVYQVSEFASAEHCVSVVREAFQVDDQELRCLVHFHLFGGNDVVFAL